MALSLYTYFFNSAYCTSEWFTIGRENRHYLVGGGGGVVRRAVALPIVSVQPLARSTVLTSIATVI